MIKFFHQAFFLLRTAWGRQWIVIWHANIQNKEKKEKKHQSVLNKHTFPKSGRYTRTFTCIHPKTERNSKNKNENKQFLNSDLHDFFSTNRLFGKTDKHLTKCLTVPSCLFVCFVSCKFFLGHFSFFSFAGWVLKWGLGWAAPACGHSKGLRSQISFLLNIYTHTRDVCVYVLQLHLIYSYSMSLTAYHHAFKFLSLTSTVIVSVPVTRQRDSCTGMSILLSDWFPCSFFFSLHIDWGRSHQHSSALLLCVCHLHSTALLHAKRCSHSQISLTECAFPHLSNHPQLNVSSEH